MEYFVPIFVRGQNGSGGMVYYIDATSVKITLLTWNFHRL